jgi:hypothetical protein
MTVKTYKIGKVMQLIELNVGENVKFDIDFYCKSVNGKDFQFRVLDQTMLDTKQIGDYQQTTDGEIGGNITSNEGDTRVYYLALKADELLDVNVSIVRKDVKESPAHAVPPKVPEVQEVQSDVAVPCPVRVQKRPWLKWVLIGGAVVICLLFAWYMFGSSSLVTKGGGATKTVTEPPKPSIKTSVSSAQPPAPSPVDPVKVSASAPKKGDLLARLRDMPGSSNKK